MQASNSAAAAQLLIANCQAATQLQVPDNTHCKLETVPSLQSEQHTLVSAYLCEGQPALAVLGEPVPLLPEQAGV